MINVRSQELRIIVSLLQELAPDCEVWAFGSRVRGENKPYSDLDLVLKARVRLPLRRVGELKEAFQESALPFRVDVADWHALSDDFKHAISAELFALNLRNSSPQVGV